MPITHNKQLKRIWSTGHGREIVPDCFHLFHFNVKAQLYFSCACSENYSPQIEFIFLKFEVEHIWNFCERSFMKFQWLTLSHICISVCALCQHAGLLGHLIILRMFRCFQRHCCVSGFYFLND